MASTKADVNIDFFLVLMSYPSETPFKKNNYQIKIILLNCSLN
jgi:hypothetical protein